MEFTGYPDLAPRDAPERRRRRSDGRGSAGRIRCTAARRGAEHGPPIVDVTLRMQEGKQYFVNRITFVGNTTTRDNVIRREIRLVESGVFNTEALKYSIKRLNQLGYFKPLEGEAIAVEKTPGADNKVDVKLKFEEQNRNQLTFGAGVSQYDGFFGQLSFQTSNFLGRGETFTVSAQQGSRATNYQLAFTEPFLFDRPHDRGRRPVHPRTAVHRALHAEVAGRQPRLRLPGRRLRADVRQLQLRERPGQGPEPGRSPTRRSSGTIRCSPIRC